MWGSSLVRRGLSNRVVLEASPILPWRWLPIVGIIGLRHFERSFHDFYSKYHTVPFVSPSLVATLEHASRKNTMMRQTLNETVSETPTRLDVESEPPSIQKTMANMFSWIHSERVFTSTAESTLQSKASSSVGLFSRWFFGNS